MRRQIQRPIQQLSASGTGSHKPQICTDKDFCNILFAMTYSDFCFRLCTD
jgi:hypothetical protein